MSYQRNLCLTAWLLLAAPLLVLGDISSDELDGNRRQFAEWHKQPEHLRRLRMNAKVFLALPEDQRQKVLRLDLDLHKQDPTTQARLVKVMERYADWLDKLDAKDRQRLKDGPDKNARLAVIKELREQ